MSGLHWIVCCLFIAVAIGCRPVRGSNSHKLRAIDVVSILPLPEHSGQISYMEDHWTLFERQGQILQQIPVKRNLSVLNIDKAGNTIGNELISLPDGSQYFFYRLGDRYGVFYDTAQHAGLMFSVASVDSMAELNTATNFEPIMKTKILNDSLVFSMESSDNLTLIEKYVPKIKKDESYGDTTVLTYLKSLNGVQFSFSRQVDSTRKMKLANIELKFSAIPNHPDLYKRKPRQLTFGIREIPITEQDYVLSIFSKLDSVSQKQGLH